MQRNFRILSASFVALVFTLLMAPEAKAVCGSGGPTPASTTNWRSPSGVPLLIHAAYEPRDDDDFAIVGFWHVKFISEGSGQFAPDGAEIDAGYSQWHSDHTEIMNSGGRSPITSNFCLGVWKQVGEHTYKLNHFATGWTPDGKTLIGTANIQETVTLDRGGNRFTGTFSIDQYTEAGNRVAHLQGNITGTRITVETLPSPIF